MGTLALIVLAVLLVLSIVALSRASARYRGRRGRYDSMAEREAALQAQAEIEEHDIDEMIVARDERRRRAGKPSIGDELAEEARREPGEADR